MEFLLQMFISVLTRLRIYHYFCSLHLLIVPSGHDGSVHGPVANVPIDSLH